MMTNKDNNNNSSKDLSSDDKSSQIVNVVPVMEERFSKRKDTHHSKK